MKQTKVILLSACLLAPLIFGACESRNKYETQTTVPASHSTTTRVVKDQIPAEGGRKIPVIKEY
ncbi:MAG: hypothetical protein ABIU29_08870 [Chthoniobacterales bacterium]